MQSFWRFINDKKSIKVWIMRWFLNESQSLDKKCPKFNKPVISQPYTVHSRVKTKQEKLNFFRKKSKKKNENCGFYLRGHSIICGRNWGQILSGIFSRDAKNRCLTAWWSRRSISSSSIVAMTTKTLKVFGSINFAWLR